MSAPIVDGHVHVWRAESVLYPARLSPGQQGDFDAPVDYLLKEMGTCGVERAVLVQPSNYEFDNRYLSECLDAYPGRFAGVARIDPVDRSAPARLALWVEKHGIRGLRLVPFRVLGGSWLKDRRTDPLWERVVELGIPLCFQGAKGMLGDLAPHIERLVERFPQLKIALDHMGHPEVGRGASSSDFRKLLALARCQNVYVKVSGHYGLSGESYPHRDTWPFMQAIYEHFGPRRMLWGSDFPYITAHCGYAKALALIRDELPFLTSEDKQWILGGTASTLWRFADER